MPVYAFLEPEIIKILAEMATDNHISISDLVAIAVTEYLAGKGGNDE